ncbi:MAG: carboxypeptidase-like regulatory domain-containing protein [Myxococcota bacterium]
MLLVLSLGLALARPEAPAAFAACADGNARRCWDALDIVLRTPRSEANYTRRVRLMERACELGNEDGCRWLLREPVEWGQVATRVLWEPALELCRISGDPDACWQWASGNGRTDEDADQACALGLSVACPDAPEALAVQTFPEVIRTIAPLGEGRLLVAVVDGSTRLAVYDPDTQALELGVVVSAYRELPRRGNGGHPGVDGPLAIFEGPMEGRKTPSWSLEVTAKGVRDHGARLTCDRQALPGGLALSTDCGSLMLRDLRVPLRSGSRPMGAIGDRLYYTDSHDASLVAIDAEREVRHPGNSRVGVMILPKIRDGVALLRADGDRLMALSAELEPVWTVHLPGVSPGARPWGRLSPKGDRLALAVGVGVTILDPSDGRILSRHLVPCSPMWWTTHGDLVCGNDKGPEHRIRVGAATSKGPRVDVSRWEGERRSKDRARTLEGVVRTPQGDPIGGAAVSALVARDTKQRNTTLTLDDGSFALPIGPDTPATLRVAREGFVEIPVGGRRLDQGPVEVVLHPVVDLEVEVRPASDGTVPGSLSVTCSQIPAATVDRLTGPRFVVRGVRRDASCRVRARIGGLTWESTTDAPSLVLEPQGTVKPRPEPVPASGQVALDIELPEGVRVLVRFEDGTTHRYPSGSRYFVDPGEATVWTWDQRSLGKRRVRLDEGTLALPRQRREVRPLVLLDEHDLPVSGVVVSLATPVSADVDSDRLHRGSSATSDLAGRVWLPTRWLPGEHILVVTKRGTTSASIEVGEIDGVIRPPRLLGWERALERRPSKVARHDLDPLMKGDRVVELCGVDVTDLTRPQMRTLQHARECPAVVMRGGERVEVTLPGGLGVPPKYSYEAP